MPRTVTCIVALCCLSAPLAAQQEISADAYLDKLRGMWLGQILGNYAGRPYEGRDDCRAGLNVTFDWPALAANNGEPFIGDDDTCFEYMHLKLLSANAAPTAQDVRQTWMTHVPVGGFYIANRQARWRMEQGLCPPDSGSIHRNIHWYAIDSQIATESIGAAAPGMVQRASDLTGLLGSASNDGYALHAAQYYAAMYSAAAFDSDVESLVAKGLQVVPTSSYTYQVVQDVQILYEADKAAGQLSDPAAWRVAQQSIFDKYFTLASAQGRYRYWIESTINTAMTTLAVLYGQGDFKQTVEIAVQSGFDADCNPATAGGLIGLAKGFSALPGDITSLAPDEYVLDSSLPSTTLQNIPSSSTISQIALEWQAVAEAQIIAAGGAITGAGPGRTYIIPDLPVSPPPPRPDPAGPAGLVKAVSDEGGNVVATASVMFGPSQNDRMQLAQIIDGVIDLSHNGRMAYMTHDGIAQSGEDWYQIDFGRRVSVNRVVFHEGDILWNGINADPAVSTPKGGYFTDLRVEVRRDGTFVPVSGLVFSEPLDALKYFQRIELSFQAEPCDAVRIIGQAGGTEYFTSIVELEAYGSAAAMLAQASFSAADIDLLFASFGEPDYDLDGDGQTDGRDVGFLLEKLMGTTYGDANLDGRCDELDLHTLACNWGQTAGWAGGDFNGDGIVGLDDLIALCNRWGYEHSDGWQDGSPVPEPASGGLAILAFCAVLARSPKVRRRARKAP